MAFIPVIGPIFTAVKGVFGAIDRSVNSAEHNFKDDLTRLLEEDETVPEELRARIRELLDTGTDEEIGLKINALLAIEAIPPALAQSVQALADQNGVPRASIDPERFGESMDAEEVRRALGPAFSPEIDAWEWRRSLLQEEDDPDSGDGGDGAGRLY